MCREYPVRFRCQGGARRTNSPWLWVPILRVFVDLFGDIHEKKKRSREVTVDLELDAYLPTCDTSGWPNIVDWSSAPEQALLSEEAQGQIQKALLEIPPKYRAVFIFRDMEGLSAAETATILGIQENTVKVQLHRARRQLRAILERYFKENGKGR